MAEIKVQKEIPVKYNQKYQSRKTSVYTLKSILKQNNYTDQQIENMFNEQRIVVMPDSLSGRLKKGQRLFVIEHQHVQDPNPQERFASIVEESDGSNDS